MDEPQLRVGGGLGLADEGVGGGPQEVPAGERAEGPPPGEVVADADLELGSLVAVVLEFPGKRKRRLYIQKKNKNRLCSMACGVDKMYKMDRLDAKRFFIEGSKKSFR